LTRASVKDGEESNGKLIVTVPSNASQTQTTALRSKQPTRASVEDLISKVQLTPDLELLPDRSTRVRGLKITARPGADLAQFKLKSGDILTRVGPEQLNTRAPNIKKLRDLLSSGAAQDFEVIRNGAPVTIRIGQ